eukprot:4899936-Amphidinium_carterae.1
MAGNEVVVDAMSLDQHDTLVASWIDIGLTLTRVSVQLSMSSRQISGLVSWHLPIAGVDTATLSLTRRLPRFNNEPIRCHLWLVLAFGTLW